MRALTLLAALLGTITALRSLGRYIDAVEADIAAGLAELEHRD